MDNDLSVHDIANGGNGWLVAQVQCLFCGHEAVSVHPADMQFFGQCSQCLNFGCMVLYYIDSEGNQVEDNRPLLKYFLEDTP